MGLEIASCSSYPSSHGIRYLSNHSMASELTLDRPNPTWIPLLTASIALGTSDLPRSSCCALSLLPSSAGAELPQRRMPMSLSHQLLQATEDFWTPSPWSTGLLHSHTPHLCGLDGGLRTPLVCIGTARLPDLQSFASLYVIGKISTWQSLPFSPSPARLRGSIIPNRSCLDAGEREQCRAMRGQVGNGRRLGRHAPTCSSSWALSGREK